MKIIDITLEQRSGGYKWPARDYTWKATGIGKDTEKDEYLGSPLLAGEGRSGLYPASTQNMS